MRWEVGGGGGESGHIVCFSRVVHELFHFLEGKSILCFQGQGWSRGGGWWRGGMSVSSSTLNPLPVTAVGRAAGLSLSWKQVVCDYLTEVPQLVGWIHFWEPLRGGRRVM